jgi:multidrug efflux pump subunit AcrB
MIVSWTDLPEAFPYCEKFQDIEGFKIINTELYRNVGLAILAVGIICLITVANLVTALLITINVAACIVEILGFMYALGLVIDSVSVINLVLAVGLSVDYSAHVGHCFMVKGGTSKDQRVIESLADIGASVVNGALSTFLAVAVLLFSTSYVFRVLSTQFALTVALGVIHGTVSQLTFAVFSTDLLLMANNDISLHLLTGLASCYAKYCWAQAFCIG